MHALVQCKLIPYKDVLINLAQPNTPYRTKKQIIAREGGGMIQELLTRALSSLGFLMY